MTNYFYSFSSNPGNLLGETPLQFHGIGTRLNKPQRVCKCFICCVICPVRKVNSDGGSKDPPADRLEVMDHFLKGHINRVFLTQNNHP